MWLSTESTIDIYAVKRSISILLHYGIAKIYEEALPELTVIEKMAYKTVFGKPYVD